MQSVTACVVAAITKEAPVVNRPDHHKDKDEDKDDSSSCSAAAAAAAAAVAAARLAPPAIREWNSLRAESKE